MANIKNVLGKSKEYTIMDEVLVLKPLCVEDMDILMDMQSEKTKAAGIKALLKKYVVQAFPEATDEERAEVGIDFMTKLMDAALDVNGMSK